MKIQILDRRLKFTKVDQTKSLKKIFTHIYSDLSYDLYWWLSSLRHKDLKKLTYLRKIHWSRFFCCFWILNLVFRFLLLLVWRNYYHYCTFVIIYNFVFFTHNILFRTGHRVGWKWDRYFGGTSRSLFSEGTTREIDLVDLRRGKVRKRVYDRKVPLLLRDFKVGLK